MDDITIGVTENVNNISVTAQPNDQIIDIAVTETVETVLLDVSTTVQEVSVTATQNVIVENITVDYVSNENHIDINVTDASQDVTLNVTPTLIEINILRSGGEVNILQFDSLADFPTTGSSDYFYLAKDTNKLYRWTGSAYAEISATANAVWGQIIGTLSEQTDLQNALNLKAPINSPTFTGTVSGITKGMVGLGAVDNTSDLDKPISTATQTALNNKQPLDADLTSIAALSGTYGLLKKTNENSYTIDTNTYLTGITSSDVTTALGFTPENAANKGIANGYASLNGDGKVPSSQLPSYVDDVIEVANYGSLPATGETGKIYITLDTNKIYRWSGSVYVEVSSSDAVWGAITGTLSNQTDLQNALNAKQDDLNGTGFVKASGTTISYDNTTYYPASNPNGYTTNVGTVTSVAMTVPSAFSVSGSPITSSGTLAVTATGDTTQYIAGDGSLVTFPTIGTAGTLIREVRNTTGATLTKGTVVYISGATGNKPTVSKAIATGDSTSAQTFGLVQADIANNTNGNVVCAGDLTGIDTSTLTEGAQLYLSSTTAGDYTTTKQYAPAHLVYIGIVTRAHPTLGQIEVNIQNGYELDELHNVAAQTPSNNDGLFYETSTSLWKNKSIATVLGYTPANGADYMALSGNQSIAGQKTFTGYGLFENGIYIKQDGTLSGIAGYNLIDANTTSIIMALPDLVGAAHFDLSGLTTFRYYNLPNASGTIALTSDIPSLAGYVATTGDQSISGVKTFTTQLHANILKFSESGGFNQTAGFTQIGGTADYFTFANGTNAKSAQFTYGTGSAFNLPNSNGTLALTSELHNAVTIGTANGLSLSTQVLSLGLASSSTNGALSSTDWNTFNNKASAASLANYLPLSGGTISTTSSSDALRVVNGGSGYALYVQSNAYFQGDAGFQSLSANGMVKADANRNLVAAVAGTDYVVPSALSSYLPLSGGTLTGALSGTSATFTDLLSTSYGTARIQVTSTTNSANSAFRLGAKDSAGTTKNAGLYYVAGLATSNTFLSLVANDNDYQFNVLANGNVGIGTTSPTDFTIYGYGANIEASGGRGGGFVSSSSSSTYKMVMSVDSSGGVGMLKTLTNHPLMFATNDTERMRITSGGNVLIGTTSSVYKLSVVGSGGINQPASFASSDTSLYIAYAANGSDVGYIGNGLGLVSGGVVGNFGVRAENNLFFAISNSERMRITSGGKVIVNTTDSGANAYLYASANMNQPYPLGAKAIDSSQGLVGFFNSSNTVIGSISCSGSTVSYNTSSDYRLKEDLKSINGLDIVNKINVYDFKWKSSNDRMDGVLAHELSEILPYAVRGKKDGEEMQGVDYSKIVPVMVQAIKDLKAELDTLKNK